MKTLKKQLAIVESYQSDPKFMEYHPNPNRLDKSKKLLQWQ
jgi:hypothetical protein